MKTYPDSVLRFQKALKASGKSPSTIESYCRDAYDFMTYIEDMTLTPDSVEPETLLNYQAYLQHSERENSIRRKIIGIRQFFRFLCDEDHSYQSPLDSVPIPERDESLPDNLSEEDIDEIEACLEALPKGLKSRRDQAIFRLLALEGLKATEIINLKWEHLLFGAQTATLKLTGSRTRVIELSRGSLDSLKQYQQFFLKNTERFSFEKEHLFISFKGKDFATVLPKMSRHGLKFLLYELGNMTGIKHLNTELLRHYAVSYQLALGKSPGEVMAHFGLRRLGNIAKHVNLKKAKESESNP